MSVDATENTAKSVSVIFEVNVRSTVTSATVEVFDGRSHSYTQLQLCSLHSASITVFRQCHRHAALIDHSPQLTGNISNIEFQQIYYKIQT